MATSLPPPPQTEVTMLPSTALTCQKQNYHQNTLQYKPLTLLFQLLSPYYHPNHRHPMQAITVAQLHDMSVNNYSMKTSRLQDVQEVCTLIPSLILGLTSKELETQRISVFILRNLT